jgi:hypothetical protein
VDSKPETTPHLFKTRNNEVRTLSLAHFIISPHSSSLLQRN